MHFKLSVKEMSEVAGISPRNLRYYDEIGLFESSGTLENGYRYYTIDKIEEIHLINYLRHMGVSIKEIRNHLSNRNMDEYSTILSGQLRRVNEEIERLETLKQRISKRINSLDFIQNLPQIGQIVIKPMRARRILRHDFSITQQSDWEFNLIQILKEHNLPPSVFIGDIGFFVDMNKVRTRGPEDFCGLFFLADDPYYAKANSVTTLEAGQWLTLYIKGDHHEAHKHYSKLLDYAQKNNLSLGHTAIERTVIDHYISSDPNLYITEIQIPILSD